MNSSETLTLLSLSTFREFQAPTYLIFEVRI